MTTNASNAAGSLPASNAWRVRERASFWVVQLAPFVLALAAYSAALFVMSPDATGDEPHYMVAAQSLAYDGDLDLTNDYASRERTERVAGSLALDTYGHAADYRDSGELRPLRGIGMATLARAGRCVGRGDGRAPADGAHRRAPRRSVVSVAQGSRLSPEVRSSGLGRGGVLLPGARVLQPGLPRASRRPAHRHCSPSDGEARVFPACARRRINRRRFARVVARALHSRFPPACSSGSSLPRAGLLCRELPTRERPG